MLKLSFQFIIKNRAKSFAILSSIILSVALLVGTGALIRSANVSKSNYYTQINGNYQYSYLMNGSQLKKLDALDKKKMGISSIGITKDIGYTDEPTVIAEVACDSNYLKMNGISLISGRFPQNDSEAVVEEWAINNIGLADSNGAVINIDGKPMKIVGVVKDSFEKYTKSIKIYTKLHEKLIDTDTYKLYVNFNLNTNIEEKSVDLMKELNIGNKNRGANWDVIEPLGYKAPSGDTHFSILSIFKNISFNENLVTVLFGVFSAFIIYSIMNVIVLQRIPQYGVLTSLGMRMTGLFRVIFVELFTLFLIGFPLGSLVGICLAKLLYSNFSHIFLSAIVEPGDFLISMKVIVNGLILMLVLLLFVSLKTVWRIRKYSDIDILLNKNKYLMQHKKTLAYKEKTLLQNVSHRYMFWNPGVFIGVIISLAIGGVLFCSTQFAVRNEKTQNELTVKADDGLNSDYTLNVQTSYFNQGISEDILKKLEVIKGVKNVSPVKCFMGATYITDKQLTNKKFFNDANKDKRLKKYFNGICTKEGGRYLVKGNIYGYGDKMITGLKDYVIKGSCNPASMDENNEVIVCLPQDGGTGKFNTINLKPGDIIKVKIPSSLEAKDDILKFQSADNNYQIKEFKIAATVKRVMAHNNYYVGPYGLDIVMTNTMMKKNFGIDQYTIVDIEKDKNRPGIRVADGIRKAIDGVERCIFTDYTTLIEKANMNLRQQQFFFIGLSVIILLISILHIFNSINYLVVARKRDFGILRAIGMNDKKFKALMIREGILYGSYASILMLVGSVLCNGLLYLYFKNVEFYLKPTLYFNGTMIFACILLNIIISILGVFISASKILKFEIVDCVGANG